MSTDSRKALQHFFGYDAFLDNQESIIDDILAGNDLCVIMPTGAGKSLCYQLPALMRHSFTVVVSPLISLMKDQVTSLTERCIPAACINTTISADEQFKIMRDAAAGYVNLLYVAPERFQTNSFRSFLRDNPPDILVVDEAHCISQWGHDFRAAIIIALLVTSSRLILRYNDLLFICFHHIDYKELSQHHYTLYSKISLFHYTFHMDFRPKACLELCHFRCNWNNSLNCSRCKLDM